MCVCVSARACVHSHFCGSQEGLKKDEKEGQTNCSACVKQSSASKRDMSAISHRFIFLTWGSSVQFNSGQYVIYACSGQSICAALLSLRRFLCHLSDSSSVGLTDDRPFLVL